MIDLSSFSALPISYNMNKGGLTFGDDVYLDDSEYISLRSLIPSLLNKSLKYPENVYHEYYNIRLTEHREILDPTDLVYDVLYIPEGLLGVEYIKSHIYFTPKSKNSQKSCVIEVFYGELTILIQRNEESEELSYYTQVEEGQLITVKAGEKALIPSGVFYTFINIAESPVIFSRVFKNKSIADYSLLKKEQGLAYFCIRKNAKCEIVRNPRYRNTPEIKEVKAEKTLDRELDFSNPLYKELRDHYKTLNEIMCS